MLAHLKMAHVYPEPHTYMQIRAPSPILNRVRVPLKSLALHLLPCASCLAPPALQLLPCAACLAPLAPLPLRRLTCAACHALLTLRWPLCAACLAPLALRRSPCAALVGEAKQKVVKLRLKEGQKSDDSPHLPRCAAAPKDEPLGIIAVYLRRSF